MATPTVPPAETEEMKVVLVRRFARAPLEKLPIDSLPEKPADREEERRRDEGAKGEREGAGLTWEEGGQQGGQEGEAGRGGHGRWNSRGVRGG